MVARSAWTLSTTPPWRRSSLAAVSISGSLAAMSRSNWFFAHSLASSSPIPLDAPVTTASGRLASSIGCLLHARLQDDLDATVLLVAKCLVEFRTLLERSDVCDDARRVDVAALDAREEL